MKIIPTVKLKVLNTGAMIIVNCSVLQRFVDSENDTLTDFVFNSKISLLLKLHTYVNKC